MFAKDLLLGERNGSLIGTKLSTVLREVLDNLGYIVFKIKKTFGTMLPRKLINFSVKKLNVF